VGEGQRAGRYFDARTPGGTGDNGERGVPGAACLCEPHLSRFPPADAALCLPSLGRDRHASRGTAACVGQAESAERLQNASGSRAAHFTFDDFALAATLRLFPRPPFYGAGRVGKALRRRAGLEWLLLALMRYPARKPDDF